MHAQGQQQEKAERNGRAEKRHWLAGLNMDYRHIRSVCRGDSGGQPSAAGGGKANRPWTTCSGSWVNSL